jgi:hypothetical protein
MLCVEYRTRLVENLEVEEVESLSLIAQNL